MAECKDQKEDIGFPEQPVDKTDRADNSVFCVGMKDEDKLALRSKNFGPIEIARFHPSLKMDLKFENICGLKDELLTVFRKCKLLTDECSRNACSVSIKVGKPSWNKEGRFTCFELRKMRVFDNHISEDYVQKLKEYEQLSYQEKITHLEIKHHETEEILTYRINTMSQEGQAGTPHLPEGKEKGYARIEEGPGYFFYPTKQEQH